MPYVYGGGGSFTVVGGALTTAVYSGFRGGNPSTQFVFDLSTPSFVLHSFNNNADLRGSSLAFSSFPQTATVPEPQSLALVALALGGAGLATRRRGASAPLNAGATEPSVC